MNKVFERLLKSAALAIGLAGMAAAPVLANQYVGGDVTVNLDTNEDVVFLAANVEATGRVGGDITVLAADVDIDVDVAGDISIAAADIFVGGQVAGEVEAAGADITIMANVMGEMSLAGADITVSGLIGGDLAVGGAIVTLEPTSVANRGVEVAASEFYAEGRIVGRVDVEAREVYLRGMFDGPIEIYARDVVIGPDAVITGPIVVRSPNAPTIAESAQVGGLDYVEERWDESRIDRPDIDLDFDVLPSFWALGALYSSAALILGLIIVLLFPRSMARMSERFRARPWVSGGLGLIVWATAWLIMLVLIVLLAITVVGVLLIPFVLASIPIIYFLSFVFGGVVIGDLIFNRSGGAAGFGIRIISLVAVLLVVAGLHVIPPLGWFIGLLVQFIGFGAWTLAIFDRQDRVQTLEGEAV